MPLPIGTLTGAVPPRGDLSNCRVVAALEFTHRRDDLPVGAPNIAIARRVDREACFRYAELLCSLSIARALEDIGSELEPSLVFEGPSAKGLSEHTGTYGELWQTKQYLEAHAYQADELALVTSPWNMGNVARQAALDSIGFGDKPAIPDNLAGDFDIRSQWWTKTRLGWMASSPLRIALLERRGH